MTKNESTISISMLREMLRLDPDTGVLYWNRRDASSFQTSAKRSAEHIANNWNSRNSGTVALNCVDGSGHLTGRINDLGFYAHRVVFAIYFGRWPQQSIDHINGDPADNRIVNLRDVSHLENHKNVKLQWNSTSGVIGVSRNKRRSKWVAHITTGGVSRHLGFFKDFDDAVAARKSAESELGFHENHGRK